MTWSWWANSLLFSCLCSLIIVIKIMNVFCIMFIRWNNVRQGENAKSKQKWMKKCNANFYLLYAKTSCKVTIYMKKKNAITMKKKKINWLYVYDLNCFSVLHFCIAFFLYCSFSSFFILPSSNEWTPVTCEWKQTKIKSLALIKHFFYLF